MNFASEVYPTWNKDYVDIHGRDLKVMMADDGSIFIPLQEIRKSGFHIFPRTEFHFSRVGKTMVLNEFRLYMLGAAKEFLIQNNVHSLNHEDILETIEKCREQLIKDDELTVHNSSQSSGLLGRTLLSDPTTINKEVRSVFQRNSHKKFNDSPPQRNENHIREIDGRQVLRMPHKDSFKPESGSSGGDSCDFRQPRNSSNYEGQQQKQSSWNGAAVRGNFNQNLQQRSSYGSNKDQNPRNRLNGNFAPNAKFASKRENDSKSASEIDESETFLRLSDCKLERIKLQKTPQEVKVVHIETNNDKQKYWVHLVANEQKVVDIMAKCQDASEYSPIFKPKLGDICLALSIEDELWYRVIVQRLNPMLKVHYIDFGNDAVVSQVKRLPEEELCTVPAQAVRVVFSKQDGEPGRQLAVDQVVSVRCLKEYADTTLLVTDDGHGGEAKPSQKEPAHEACFLLQTKYSTVLKDGEIVKIVAYENGKFYLQNKEHHVKLKEIATHIKDLPKQHLSKVERNQLVVCKKDGEEQMCRAVVRDIDDGFVSVQFVDFRTNDSMSVKGLYAVSRATVSLPVALIESPVIKGYSDGKLTAEAESLIDDVIEKKQKFAVSMNGTEFDLLANGKPLSEMLFPADKRLEKFDLKLKSDTKSETSSPSAANDLQRERHSEEQTKKADESSVASARITYESMTSFEAPLGRGDYMLTAFKDTQDFTVTSTGDEESDMLSKCTAVEVGAGEGPYEPIDTEMVLGRFEGDWYRGVVLDVLDDGKYQIIFVEYGNVVELTKEDIRKFPDELKEIPMLGLMCRLDVPETEAVKKRLEELLKPENIYEIDFISYDTEHLLYTVKIPKVHDILNREGLL